MSESSKDEDKTEEATQKKITDSLEEGNIPISRDASVVALIFSLLVYIKIIMPLTMEGETVRLSMFIDHAHDIKINSATDLLKLFREMAYRLVGIVLSVAGPILLLGVASFLIQAKLGFHLNKIAPKFSNISLVSGLKRLTSAKNLVEWLKSIIKLTGVLIVVANLLYYVLNVLLASVHVELENLPGTLANMAFLLLLWVLALLIVLFAFDLFYTRYSWIKDLRMSRHEIKEEMRQAEGNPLVKSRLRAIAANRSRRRMMADVSKSTVVIVNPTHYAVALRYDIEVDESPRVVAKGVDSLALRIRRVAEEHDVPIVDNQALARALYAQVEIHASIPPELYRVVAEVLVFLNTRMSKVGPK
jgi:flagellar biosynthetic protein FlhB